MTKRFRQASLSFEKKRLALAEEDSVLDEGSQVQAEGASSVASTSDESNVQVIVCESLCCVDCTEPYQPSNQSVLQTMAGISFKTYPWLSICVTRKKVFCFHCRNATSKGLLTFSTKAEPTFTSIGFNNWKKALEKFRSHSQCDAHQEAILKCHMIHTTPVTSQLASAAKKEQSERRDALVKQLYCIRYTSPSGAGFSWA